MKSLQKILGMNGLSTGTNGLDPGSASTVKVRYHNDCVGFKFLDLRAPSMVREDAVCPTEIPTTESTCEEVCTYICQHKLSIIPLTSHLFGIAASKNGGQTFIWKSPRETLESCAQEDIYFRVRFLPSPKGFDKLQRGDASFIEYLYNQLSSDFVSGRFSEDVLRQQYEKMLGVGVLGMLILKRSIEAADGRELSTERFFRNIHLKDYLPDCVRKSRNEGRLTKGLLNSIDTNNLRNGLKTGLEKMQGENPASSVDSLTLLKSYIVNLLYLIPAIYMESYDPVYRLKIEKEKQTGDNETSQERSREETLVVRSKTPVGICVDLRHNEQNFRVSTREEKPELTWKIAEVMSIDKREEKLPNGDTMWLVQILLESSRQDFYFDSHDSALSFVGCLDGYYRLTCDYTNSLSKELTPSFITDLAQLRCHGPVSDEFCWRKLKRRYKSSPDYFVLRHSIQNFNEYEVLYYNKFGPQKEILGRVVRVRDGYQMEGQEEVAASVKKLLLDRVRQLKILPENSTRVPVQSLEVCDLLQNLLQEGGSSAVTSEDGEEEELGKREGLSQPKVFLPSSVQTQHCIGFGRMNLSKVYRAVLRRPDGLEYIAAKELCGAPDIFKHVCRESLEDGIQTLMTLNMPHSSGAGTSNGYRHFVQFLGLSLASPTLVLMEHAQYGSLANFLTTASERLILEDLAEMAVQVAKGLLHMEETSLCHGNLCCHNVLVFKFVSGEDIKVKIGDPGLVTLYHQLPLDHDVNRRRLPWLAPELFDNLRKGLSLEADVYAYGTTLWEMFSQAASPLDPGCQLHDKTVEEIVQFYNTGKTLSVPAWLEECPSDTPKQKSLKKGLLNVMYMCWDVDAHERPCPMKVVKELSKHVECYADANPLSMLRSSRQGDLSESDHPSVLQEEDYQFEQIQLYSRTNLARGDNNLARGDNSQAGGLAARPRERQAPLQPSVLANTKKPESENTSHKPRANQRGNTVETPTKQTVPERRKRPELPPLPALPAPPVPPEGLKVLQSPPASSQRPKLEHLISEKRLDVDHQVMLGDGHYGKVLKGSLKDTISTSGGRGSFTPVAVKVVQDPKYQEELKKEAEVMKLLEHTNIVKFYGVCRQGEYLVMELMENGSLLKVLVKHRKAKETMASSRQLQFCIDIAAGMAYLSAQHVIHLDLATRNVLLSKNNVAKVADFGLSKILSADKDYYRRGTQRVLPIYWCSPEWWGHPNKCTTQSDVWSYGVVLWEIYSYGRTPNFDLSEVQFAKEAYLMLLNGQRLKQPSGCPDDLYAVMQQCWDLDPEKRPTFAQLQDRLRPVMESLTVGTQHNDNTGSSGSSGTHPTGLVSSVPSSSSPKEREPAMTKHAGASNIADYQLNVVNESGKVELRHFFISAKEIEINEEEPLGTGAFGKVCLGSFREGPDKGMKVAVKYFASKSEYQMRFNREIEIHSLMKHANIVSFLGALEEPEQAFVMEFMERGSLKKHLMKCREDNSFPNLHRNLSFLTDIAKGMAHLSENNVWHLDLTADNVLLNQDLVAKISDFGLGKRVEEDDSWYSRKHLTFKPAWTAPEITHKKAYHKNSDVWSFGVVAWEIFTVGESPKDKKKKGQSLPQPPGCPDTVYGIMSNCWTESCENRPSFEALVQQISELLASVPDSDTGRGVDRGD